MAHLYADEDFSFPVVERLRHMGHDVLTAQEAGQSNRGTPDSAVLALAIAQRRAVITFNRRHFIRLHRFASNHFGIVACTRDADVDALAARIDREIANRISLANQLIRVTRPQKP